MKKSSFFLLGLLLGLPILVFGQSRKVFHQTFELDSVKVMFFDVVDSIKVEPWAGNVVLAETKIMVLNASKGVLNYLVEEDGRYHVDVNMTQDTFSMVSRKRERPTMHTADGRIMEEEVYIRVFIPEDYEMVEPNIWILPEEEEEEKDPGKNEAPKQN